MKARNRDMRIRSFVMGFALLIFSGSAFAQGLPRVIEVGPQQGYLIGVQYSLLFPAADFAERFGIHSGLGLSVQYKTRKNLQFGLQYQALFGENVKEDNVLDILKNKDGQIVDANGNFSVINLAHRGHVMSADFCKVFGGKGIHVNSGFFAEAGVGMIWHKILIQASQVTVPQLTEEYKKGYDRLSGGLLLRQWFGYQFLDPGKRINFKAGLELGQGFTQSWRSWDIDRMAADTRKRKDLYAGFKISMILPVYTKAAEDEQFFR